MAETFKKPGDVFTPPQMVSATVTYGNQTIRKAKLTVPYDLTETGLPTALKSALGIPQSQQVEIRRYSKSSDKYVLLDKKSEFEAIFRSLKVKRKFSFHVKDYVPPKENQKEKASATTIENGNGNGHDSDNHQSNKRAKTHHGHRNATDTLINDVFIQNLVNNQDFVNRLNEKLSELKLSSEETTRTAEVWGEQKPEEKSASCGTTTTGIDHAHSKALHCASCDKCEKLISGLRYKCLDCHDYDLCEHCVTMRQAIHPNHSFVCVHNESDLLLCNNGKAMKTQSPVVEAQQKQEHQPEYKQAEHRAFCDGCDKRIYGTRNKCVDCPDFDYCDECYDMNFISHGHTFVKIRNPEDYMQPKVKKPVVFHRNIYCDGPLCKNNASIVKGARFKCGICNDVDFCEKCEACPQFDHDPSHPLVKMREPARPEGLDVDLGAVTWRSDDINAAAAAAAAVAHPSALGSTVGHVANNPDLLVVNKKLKEVESKQEPEVVESPKVEEPTTVESKLQYAAELVEFSCQKNGCLTWVFKNVGLDTWQGYTKVIPADQEVNNDLVTMSYSPFTTSNGQTSSFTAFIKTPDLDTVPTKWTLMTPDGSKFGERDYSEEIYKVMKQVGANCLSGKQLSLTYNQGMAIAKVENDGENAWPVGVYLKIGDAQSVQTAYEVAPGESVMFSVFTESDDPCKLYFGDDKVPMKEAESGDSMESSNVVLPSLPRESPHASLSGLTGLDHEEPQKPALSEHSYGIEDDEYEAHSDDVMFSDSEELTDSGYDVVDISELSEVE